MLAYASVGWAAVSGRIIKSRMVKSRGSNGETAWQPEVQYQYEVAGKSFSGARIAYHLSGGTTAGASAMTLNEYPVGQTVTVYYDPAAPARAALENGAGPNNWIFLFIASGLSAGFIWAAVTHA